MNSLVKYEVSLASRHAHIYEVACYVESPRSKELEFFLPKWVPGSYLIRDFARHVVQLKVFQEERPISVEKLNSHTWRCAPTKGPVVIRYQVYAWDLSVRGAHLDLYHGFFDGSRIFMCIKGFEHQPLELELIAGDTDWKVATSLPALNAPKWGFGTYHAPDYETLIDHPVEMGHFEVFSFTANEIVHEVAITGTHLGCVKRLQADLQKICTTIQEFFKGPSPCPHYLFLLTLVEQGYGGLEHRHSTALIAQKEAMPIPGVAEPSPAYQGLLGLFSHEYFHAWNVKRILPKEFLPYNLHQEVYTRQLWAFEGFTAYYDDKMLLKSGVISKQAYFSLFAQQMGRLKQVTGQFKQSLKESSFDAWTKFYKQDENAPNAIVSYYNKGALVAFCLDVYLLESSNGAQGLGTIMHTLWQQFGINKTGVKEGEIEALIIEQGGPAFKGILERFLSGYQELPLTECLNKIGFNVNWLHNPKYEALGQYVDNSKPKESFGLGGSLGVVLSGGVITKVYEGMPAFQHGLGKGDQLVAIEGFELTPKNIASVVQRIPIDRPVRVHFFREGQLRQIKLKLGPAPAHYAEISMGEHSEAHQALYQAWLSG